MRTGEESALTISRRTRPRSSEYAGGPVLSRGGNGGTGEPASAMPMTLCVHMREAFTGIRKMDDQPQSAFGNASKNLRTAN